MTLTSEEVEDTDSVPTLLLSGSYYVPPEVAARWSPTLLQKLNRSSLNCVASTGGQINFEVKI